MVISIVAEEFWEIFYVGLGSKLVAGFELVKNKHRHHLHIKL
ncbi:hypothetical protein VB620_03080 [Nodularia harveyana UHCC-0300]|uniref:Uncharacterized protein n=1 Tax=Nodularia harveyana UHCC-0300 TaxID=2974287 RepID=A0ABU5UD15_9CYAN|nr:hypothetical protein [Nodularia harveyana]MEA5580321.1 hypothetical protein [Nodularia harveyana UHCC-0300]